MPANASPDSRGSAGQSLDTSAPRKRGRMSDRNSRRGLKKAINVMPDFMREALEKAGVYTLYLQRPAYQQNDYIAWIHNAAREDTRQRRLGQMIDELKDGSLYMKMCYKGATSGVSARNWQNDSPQIVEAYIDGFPEDIRLKLQEIRRLGLELVPGGIEKLSYGMPSFHLRKPVFYYAGFKGHIGFYPTASGIAQFEDQLVTYAHSKGAIRLRIDEDLPMDLLRRIIAYKVKEIEDMPRS